MVTSEEDVALADLKVMPDKELVLLEEEEGDGRIEAVTTVQSPNSI